MFSLYALKNDLLLTAANPLHLLPAHEVGAQPQQCQAYAPMGTGEGAGAPYLHMHNFAGEDSGSALTVVTSNFPTCGDTNVGDDNLFALLFRFTAWFAVVLTVGCIAKAAWTAFTRSGTGFGQALKEVSTPLLVGAILGSIYIIPLYVLPLITRFVTVALESIESLFG